MKSLRVEKPVTVMFELTDRCNIACAHCYGLFGRPPRKEPKRFQRLLERLIEEDFLLYTLTGGEPMMRKDLVYKALEHLKKSNALVNINTNATLMTDEDCRKLKDMGLGGALVSLISYNEQKHDMIANTKGAYRRTLRGIEHLQKNGLFVSVNMVVTKPNFEDVLQTGRFVKSRGIKSFSATPIQPTCPEHREQILSTEQSIEVCNSLNQLQKEGLRVDVLEPFVYCMFPDPTGYEKFFGRACMGGITDIYIDSEGNARPCGLTGEPVGNIIDDSLEILTERMKSFCSEECNSNSIIPKECYECAEVKACRGGCRAAAYGIHGEVTAPNPYFSKPLKEKVEREEKKTFDFINTEYGDLEKVMGFRIGNIRLKEQKSESYVLITPSNLVRAVPREIVQIYADFATSNPRTNKDVKALADKQGIPYNVLNTCLNILLK